MSTTYVMRAVRSSTLTRVVLPPAICCGFDTTALRNGPWLPYVSRTYPTAASVAAAAMRQVPGAGAGAGAPTGAGAIGAIGPKVPNVESGPLVPRLSTFEVCPGM